MVLDLVLLLRSFKLQTEGKIGVDNGQIKVRQYDKYRNHAASNLVTKQRKDFKIIETTKQKLNCQALTVVKQIPGHDLGM